MDNKFSVLIIDDEVEVLQTIKSIYEEFFSCEIETCNSAVCAMTMMDAKKYDVINLDHRMPEMMGCELVLSLRDKKLDASMGKHLNSDTPIIILSGFIPEVEEKLTKAKVENIYYLEKPIFEQGIKDLKSIIHKIID